MGKRLGSVSGSWGGHMSCILSLPLFPPNSQWSRPAPHEYPAASARLTPKKQDGILLALQQHGRRDTRRRHRCRLTAGRPCEGLPLALSCPEQARNTEMTISATRICNWPSLYCLSVISYQQKSCIPYFSYQQFAIKRKK